MNAYALEIGQRVEPAGSENKTIRWTRFDTVRASSRRQAIKTFRFTQSDEFGRPFFRVRGIPSNTTTKMFS